MPELLNGWAILTFAKPFSLAAKADGIQSTATSAPPPASTLIGPISGPPGLIVTFNPSAS